MSEELEALKRIRREAGIPYFSALYDFDMWKEDFELVEKSLKALEIIKKKLSPLARATFLPMTNEEFDLVNEVFKP